MQDQPIGQPLLDVRNLCVAFDTPGGLVQAVRGISYEVERGSAVALVGESGSGKSVGVRAVLGLVRERSARVSGSARLDGVELIGLAGDSLRKIRGVRAAVVNQDPLSALNPVMTISTQIAEMFVVHRGASWSEGRRHAIELLQRVAIPKAVQRAGQYPHEFSGGMRQRVAIAMAIALGPDLLIADEPTTALDVTVQAQILELLNTLRMEQGMSLVLITHDVGVAAEVADRILVMYAGRLVEQGDAADILGGPTHPYTQGLLAAVPRVEHRSERLVSLPGQPPDPRNLPVGCAFQARCPLAEAACALGVPAEMTISQTHRSECIHAHGLGRPEIRHE